MQDVNNHSRTVHFVGWGIVVLFALRIVQDVLHPFFISHDAALELHCASLLMAGWVPYIDFIELNPPLIIYLNMLPVWIGDKVGLHHIIVFKVLILTAVSWSVWRLDKVVKEEIGNSGRFWMVLPYTLFMLFLCDVQYGQREHIFIALFLPYLLCRNQSWQGKNTDWAGSFILGFIAGIASSIKPHFLLIPLIIEVWVYLRHRQVKTIFRPEVAGFIIAGLIHAIHFLFLPQAIREALFDRWIPFIASGYVVYEESFRQVLLHSRILSVCIVILATIVIRQSLASKMNFLGRAFEAMLVAAMAMYLLQMKGWPYQMIPPVAAALLVVGLWATGSPEWRSRRLSRWFNQKRRNLPRIAAQVAITLLIPFAVLKGFQQHRQASAETSQIRPIVEQYVAIADTVTFIATSVDAAYPIMERNGYYPGSRYLWHFPIPMFYCNETLSGERDVPYHSFSQQSGEERRYIQELREDLTRGNSRVIVISSSDNSFKCPPGFNVEEYLRVLGFFSFWEDSYTIVAEVDGYTIHVRNDIVISKNNSKDREPQESF